MGASSQLLHEIFSIVPIPDDAPPSRRARFRDLVRRWRAAPPDPPRPRRVVPAGLRPFIEALRRTLVAQALRELGVRS
jgi:hypothetical protein